MNNTELYKQFYLKELSTKNDLNNAINLPMAVLTVLVSVHLYLFTKTTGTALTLITFFSSGNFVAICFCIFFLAKSFFNFGRTHKYAELKGMDSFYDFQKQLEEKKTEDKFIPHLEQQLSACAGINFEVNKTRTESLATAKQALFISISISFISCTTFIISFILKT